MKASVTWRSQIFEVMNSKSIVIPLKRLWRHISQHRRVQFVLLLILMVLTSFAEILSIGAVIPFLAVLTDPSVVFSYVSIQPIIQYMGLDVPTQLLMPITVTFCFAVLVSAGMRLLLLWVSTRLSFATGADLSSSIYRRTLYQSYAVHIAQNSSEIIDGISGKTNNATHLINLALNLISSCIMMIVIFITLLAIDPGVALTVFGVFGFIYFLIFKLTRKRLLINSHTVARESSRVIQLLQEGLGGIRDVLIDGSQETFCKIYLNSDQRLRRAQGNNTFISSSPRSVMEALGMVSIAILAYALSQEEEGIKTAIPVLGAVAIGAQRLLPVLQQTYSSYSSIIGGKSALQDVLNLLDQPLPDHLHQPELKPVAFHEQICLKQISFRYSPSTQWVLENLNLVIKKGSRIGFVGATGSGKSTLLDILTGLLQPTTGFIEVDGKSVTLSNQRAWQAHIATVPQTIFLADGTIAENIAFGVPESQIDISLIQQVSKQAQISEVIESWPKKYQTLVGERGIRLSGGQRQRIGIARALYKRADVIIFDEATSALDKSTEQAVMKAIEGLGKDLTILIIAHRLTSLECCTQIVELGGAGIKLFSSYEDMISRSI